MTPVGTIDPSVPGRAICAPRPGVFAYARVDAALLGAALALAALLVGTAPLAPAATPLTAAVWGLAFAVSIWWCSNTVSHNHLHNPLFRSRAANRAFSLFLTALLGIPQTLWKQRHMRHHADLPASSGIRWPGSKVAREALLVGVVWAGLLVAAPLFFGLVYLPAWAAGLALCSLQGHYEHVAGPAGVSHYGRVHNLLWFNDGYHAEHHRWPRMHWSVLPTNRLPDATSDPHPPATRWLTPLRPRILCGLERIALRSGWLQRAMVRCHARAFRVVLRDLDPKHVLVVGGGLFPRSVLVLHQVAPQARVTVLDASAEHLARARGHLDARGVDSPEVRFQRGRYEPSAVPHDVDLVVLPLALDGDRQALFEARAPAPRLVHAWLWESRGRASAVVSRLLLKRVTLV